MDDKNPRLALSPSTRTTTCSKKIPSTIDVSASQDTKHDSLLQNQQGFLDNEKDSISPRKGMGMDKSYTPAIDQAHSSMKELDFASAIDQAHSSMKELDFASTLSELSDSSSKFKNAANTSVEVGRSTEIDESMEILDRLRIDNEKLVLENEQLRMVIEAMRNKEEQERQSINYNLDWDDHGTKQQGT